MVTIDTTHDDALREVPFSKETIYDGHILHVEKWRVTCPNGREAPREIVVHKGAAAVVPVFDNGDTLLVRQHRVAVDRVTLERGSAGLRDARAARGNRPFRRAHDLPDHAFDHAGVLHGENRRLSGAGALSGRHAPG